MLQTMLIKAGRHIAVCGTCCPLTSPCTLICFPPSWAMLICLPETRNPTNLGQAIMGVCSIITLSSSGVFKSDG